MFFASSPTKLQSKFNAPWFATHPPLEERVQALDARISPIKFRAMVSDQRRKLVAKAAAPDEGAKAPEAASVLAAADDLPLMAMASPELAMPTATASPAASPAPELATAGMALAETMPGGVRLIGGRSLPPDVLRNRLSQEQQAAITAFVTQVESSAIAVQATFVAAMLASEPAKWRTQLTRLAPLLGIELFKATQAQIARLAQLAPASRLPLLVDLLALLDGVEPADRKRLRAVARAFAPTVATGDMLRFSLTRMIEARLRKAGEQSLPVPLPERAAAVCELYAALAQCRFGAGKQGQNAYRAGVMGMLMPTKWAPYPEQLIAPAALDIALAGVAQIHPTGKRALSEGMARVIAVGGRMTVPQVDLLRGTCIIVDCAVPVIPIDVVFEEADLMIPKSQASAR